MGINKKCHPTSLKESIISKKKIYKIVYDTRTISQMNCEIDSFKQEQF
jgi:hypothetical protein